MSVLFLSTDLVFTSRLAAAGKRLGISVIALPSIDLAVERVNGDVADLVICDLSALGADPQTIVARLRTLQPELPIVAYAPHVHEDRLRAASDAGCNEVFTRGQFDRQMDEILTRYARSN
jgi:CheY-like chemotaxis protein